MLTKILLASVATMLLFSSVQAAYTPELYCSLVPVGTKLPNLDDCHQFYTCISPNMVNAGKCPNNQVFSKDSQGCIVTPNGSCASLTNACENLNEKWVPDPNVCGNWYYCKNGNISGSGHCKHGQNLDYDKQVCNNSPCSVVDNSGGVNNLCTIMQNGKFFGDFKDCKTWHKCNGLEMKSGQCKDTIYDSASRQCVHSNGNTCGGPTETCTVVGTKLPDAFVCSNYFVCGQENDTFEWTKRSCAKGQFYDVTSQTCTSRQKATPVATCDRCEYSTSAWVNAVDPECQKYLFCTNGVKTGVLDCKKGFFDEQQQRCTIGGDLSKYRETNGACAETSANNDGRTK